MKRVVLRIGCGAVCAALALTLGCGCALLPPATGVPGAASSAVSVPTDDSGKPLYDPAVLNDDRLRVLYCYDRAGSSTTILCGSTPLHQSARSENVSLVEDSATGTADYWLRSWSDPTGRAGAAPPCTIRLAPKCCPLRASRAPLCKTACWCCRRAA